MSRPYDARAMRSREALQEALLALIAERDLDQISIRDITLRAEVSYPVFFRRYASKEQLLEDIATAEVRNLLSLSLPIFEANRQEESLQALCRYVDEHRPLWTRLLTGGAMSAMRKEFTRIAAEISATLDTADAWLPIDLSAPFFAGGMFEILGWWLRQPEDYPIENVVRIIRALIIRSAEMPGDVRLA